MKILFQGDSVTDAGRNYDEKSAFNTYGQGYANLVASTLQLERPGELETCFNALYGVMMLHLQGKEISQDTAAAISQISHFIGMLAAYYKRDEEKPLFGEDLIEN